MLLRRHQSMESFQGQCAYSEIIPKGRLYISSLLSSMKMAKKSLPCSFHLFSFLESNALSEHFCRAQDDRLWNGQSQRFGRLHVDDELELGGLLEREIIEFRPLENLVHL